MMVRPCTLITSCPPRRRLLCLLLIALTTSFLPRCVVAFVSRPTSWSRWRKSHPEVSTSFYENQCEPQSSRRIAASCLKLATQNDNDNHPWWHEFATTNDNDTTRRPPVHSVVIVGGGILGSSVALSLAQCDNPRLHNITLVEATSSFGVTTPASWAWLNANGKSPPAYATLNRWGMHGWRVAEVWQQARPVWCGSLVRLDQPPPAPPAEYRRQGPLSTAQVQELEPCADFRDDEEDEQTYTYYFPDEGLVDPTEAVRVLRQEAQARGVQILTQHNVTGFVREPNDKIAGVVTVNVEGEEVTLHADVVVLAAGIQCEHLADIPLLHRPGQIAFVRSSSSSKSLQRILVDTVRESHVLQRRDGTVVIGGGALEVGGDGRRQALETKGVSVHGQETTATTTTTTSTNHPLLRTAQQVVPHVPFGDLLRTETAVRPIPLDGLPAVGFCAPGLYTVVSHSGVTLAPILGALVATELTTGTNVTALESFRPDRFFDPQDR